MNDTVNNPVSVTAAPGAVACVVSLAKKRLNRALTPEQGASLWLECRALMVENAWPLSVIREIEEDNESGSLDTFPRDFLLDAMSLVIAGVEWPANMATKEESDRFFDGACIGMASRGYAKFESDEQATATAEEKTAGHSVLLFKATRAPRSFGSGLGRKEAIAEAERLYEIAKTLPVTGVSFMVTSDEGARVCLQRGHLPRGFSALHQCGGF
jgi:hypothetical protein